MRKTWGNKPVPPYRPTVGRFEAKVGQPETYGT